MAIAHVLINCDLGFEAEVMNQLKAIKGVSEARCVFGAYDVIAKIESSSREGIRNVVTSKIRKMDHVRTTLTLVGIESQM